MKLPKAKKLYAEKYVAGLSLFNQKVAKIKLSANESALGPSPKAIKEYIKVSKNFKRYPDSDGTFLKLGYRRLLGPYPRIEDRYTDTHTDTLRHTPGF